MTQLKVALLQLTACGNDQQANLTKGEKFCREAQTMGADIALFPEMWNIGYTGYEDEAQRAAWQNQAVSESDDFIVHFRDLARELNMAIAITYLGKWSGAPRNTVSIIDRHGEIVLTYAKVHTCDFGFERACTPGSDFYVCALDTAQGIVQVGAMICYDREFPESARILMLKGAEIILTPNACGLEPHRLMQFQTRAYENMVGLAMTNYAGSDFKGHSIAVDGIAFGEGWSRDMLIVEAGESEGIYIADFDVEKLRDYRSSEVWGNAFRKPHAYEALTTFEVRSPFLRDSARRP